MKSLMRMLLVLIRVALLVGTGLQMVWQQGLVAKVTVASMNVSNSRYRFCVANGGCRMPGYDTQGRSCRQHSASGHGVRTSVSDNDIRTQAYTDNKPIPNECGNYRCRSDQICVYIRQSGHHLCQTVTTNSPTWRCTNRFTGFVEFNGSQSVSCKKDEVLTDCSSEIRGFGRNNGVKVVLFKGLRACQVDTTYVAGNVPQALRAVARCCRKYGLECNYVSSGPSGFLKNDSAVAECSNSSKVLGCSAHLVNGWLDGIQIAPDYCHAFTGWYSKTGVTSFATCCQAPGLNCSVYTASYPPVGRLMKATCPPGSTLTGCSGYHARCQQRGSFIKDVSGTSACYVEGPSKKSIIYFVCCT